MKSSRAHRRKAALARVAEAAKLGIPYKGKRALKKTKRKIADGKISSSGIAEVVY